MNSLHEQGWYFDFKKFDNRNFKCWIFRNHTGSVWSRNPQTKVSGECICSNCYFFTCLNCQMYLFKLLNSLVQNCQRLRFLTIVFVPICKCICPNWRKKYFSKIQKLVKVEPHEITRVHSGADSLQTKVSNECICLNYKLYICQNWQMYLSIL